VKEQLVTTAASADALGVLVGAVGAAGLFSLLIVIVWQVAATWRARMLAAREQQYKELATKYAQLRETR
jgi:hypothetical protein